MQTRTFLYGDQKDRKYYSLGDIAYGSHKQPTIAVIVKSSEADALEPPAYFCKRWDDSGSGANDTVSFWEPI